MAAAVLMDPLNRAFVLADTTWYEHILVGHPEMATHRSLVEQAIIAPLSI
jgi:hypothetical protein